jgi:hypothetical protein
MTRAGKDAAAGPTFTIAGEQGAVEIWSLGNDRHRVVAEPLGVDIVVVGRPYARRLAEALAPRLGAGGARRG